MSDDGWTWALATRAQRDLEDLSPATQDQILEKLDAIIDSP